MRSIKSVCTAFLAVLFCSNAFADVTPIEFDNQYKARLYGFNISVTNKLTHKGNNRYELFFKFDSLVGTISETSHMEWLPETESVRPLHYVYKRRGLGKDRDADLQFDWATHSVTNNVQKTTWKMGIKDAVQDKLSYQAQLQLDLVKGLESFSYQIADGGRLKDYDFVIVGEELLETPLGRVNTIKVKRSRENDDRVTYAWLAKDWQYLLVRLQQEEDGKKTTIYIHKASVNGKNIDKF